MDAVGNVLSNTSNNTADASGIDQEEFIKLFLTQLNFQDPLEPIDNREFLAQIAQFSALEQARISGERIGDLVTLGSTTQAMGLVGKNVQVAANNIEIAGTVSAVRFTVEGVRLTVTLLPGGNILEDVRLSQISLVR